MTDSQALISVSPRPPISYAVKFGLLIIVIFIGGFLLWALLAPLESAAVSQGKIIVDSSRKTIEHLEGGIIKKIFVEEGSVVVDGELLIELDDTQAKAKFDLLRGQTNELLAEQGRLVAERQLSETIAFPELLTSQLPNEKVEEIMKSQEAIFENNKKTYNGQIEILHQRITQLEKEIDSLQAQVDADARQLALINEEIEAVAYLEERKLIERPRLLALQREAARLEGERGENAGLIARAQQRIGETQQQIYTFQDSFRKDVLDQLREVQRQLTDLLEQTKSAADILARTEIRSPQDGVVVGLKKHTRGGVVSPGEELMEIVPTKDELIVEVRVSPMDIDVVKPGLVAKVRLSAYKQRNTPTVEGEVKTVSGDIFQDEKTGRSYYTARVNIYPEELQRLKNVSLYPGMPAQVMIITEKRTPMGYFITPIKETFNRAFREQ